MKKRPLRAIGFSLGSKGYIGTGANAASARKTDFWEYTPIDAAGAVKVNAKVILEGPYSRSWGS